MDAVIGIFCQWGVVTYQILPTALPVVIPAAVVVADDYRDASDVAWATALEKVPALIAEHPNQFPLYTMQGKWVVQGESWTNWCEGFLGGQLWMLANRTGREDLRVAAERYSLLIEERQHDRSVHDLGFLFWSTWRRWFEETGDASRDRVVVQAGTTMSLRFNEKGRYLRSFLAPDSLFIDIMMNVGVVFHAAQRTGDARLATIAAEHCLTTRRYLVRGDGSIAHEGIFDLETGAFLRQSTQQGFRADGSWARGQAWALYGFGTAYRYTGDRRFLDTAQACADFYIDRTGAALVPPNDWEEPAPRLPYESSAAAITAGGLWQLAGLVQDTARAWRYADYSVAILKRLCLPDFLSVGEPTWEGLLKHGVYHGGKGLGVDESVMWGDYWFLDALDAVDKHLVERTSRSLSATPSTEPDAAIAARSNGTQ
jgi:unsaturated chondroitin disaccharide hydrolase